MDSPIGMDFIEWNPTEWGRTADAVRATLKFAQKKQNNARRVPSSAFIAEATPNSYPTPPYPADSRPNAQVIAHSEVVMNIKGPYTPASKRKACSTLDAAARTGPIAP